MVVTCFMVLQLQFTDSYATVLCLGSTVRRCVRSAHADLVCRDFYLCALYNH